MPTNDTRGIWRGKTMPKYNGEVGGCGFIYLGGTKGRPHTARNARSATVNKIKKHRPERTRKAAKIMCYSGIIPQ